MTDAEILEAVFDLARVAADAHEGMRARVTGTAGTVEVEMRIDWVHMGRVSWEWCELRSMASPLMCRTAIVAVAMSVSRRASEEDECQMSEGS